MQATAQQWVVFLIMLATAATAFAISIKQASLFSWVVAALAISSAIILVLQQQPRSWWVALIGAILGFSVIWLITRNI
jgi:hypothetical protein